MLPPWSCYLLDSGFKLDCYFSFVSWCWSASIFRDWWIWSRCVCCHDPIVLNFHVEKNPCCEAFVYELQLQCKVVSEVDTKRRDLEMFASNFLGSHGNEWNREKPRPLGSISAIKSFHRNAHVPAIRRYVSTTYLIDAFVLVTVRNAYDFKFSLWYTSSQTMFDNNIIFNEAFAKQLAFHMHMFQKHSSKETLVLLSKISQFC